MTVSADVWTLDNVLAFTFRSGINGWHGKNNIRFHRFFPSAFPIYYPIHLLCHAIGWWLSQVSYNYDS